MLTAHPQTTQDVHVLTPAERDWIRRQGRAARTLETRQRRSLHAPRRRAPRATARPGR